MEKILIGVAIWITVSLIVSPLIGAFLGFNDREVKR